MNSTAFIYQLGLTYLAHSPYVKDPGVFLDRGLYFHSHVGHIVAQAFRVLGLICYIMSSISSTDTLVTMYYALVHSKLELASVAWNSVMLTDSSKTERVQKKFANLCNDRFLFKLGSKKYKEIFARLNIPPLHLRWQYVDALFLNDFVNKIICPFILHSAGLRVPFKITRDHSKFTAPYCAKASPSARFVSAANAFDSKTVVFNHHGISLEYLIVSNIT